MSITVDQLVEFAKRKKNVLLSGMHGIGKTTMIVEAFQKHYGQRNVDWLYFNGSTLDPWLNFIGIPKTIKNDQNEEVMRIVPPEHMPNSIRAIYIDELNRAPREVRNAVMELLQFKSINGRPFPQLEVVWSSINPSDDETDFDVESLDPAQEDRFQVQITLPYTLSKPYFEKKYGKDIANVAMKWWNALNREARLLVSPRRLDEALLGYFEGDKLRFYLADKLPHGKLAEELSKVIETNKFMDIIKKLTTQDIPAYFTLDRILEKAELLGQETKFFKENVLPYLSENVIRALVKDRSRALNPIRDAIIEAKPLLDIGPTIIRREGKFTAEHFLETVKKAGNHSKTALGGVKANYKEMHKMVQDDVRKTRVENICKNQGQILGGLQMLLSVWTQIFASGESIDSKAAYILLEAEMNSTKLMGLISLISQVERFATQDFRGFVRGSKKHGLNGALLDMTATLSLVALAQQCQKRGLLGGLPVVNEFYSSYPVRRAVWSLVKILRSSDIVKSLQTQLADPQLVDDLKRAMTLVASEKKDNFPVVDLYVDRVEGILRSNQD